LDLGSRGEELQVIWEQRGGVTGDLWSRREELQVIWAAEGRSYR